MASPTLRSRQRARDLASTGRISKVSQMNAARAAQEDFRDSAERLTEIHSPGSAFASRRRLSRCGRRSRRLANCSASIRYLSP